jgi:hypothetical protein
MGVASSRELDEVELQGNQTLMQANSGVASRLAESRAATSRTSRSVFLIGVGLACYIARSVRPQPRLAARSRPAGSVLQPAGAARDARRGARLLALFWPPGRRRRCSAQTVADEDAVGGFGHAAEPAARYGLRARRPLLGMLQSQKRASAGTEAVQRKEEKYDSATIAHDRVIRRQFLVIGQRPRRPRSSSTRWTSTVGTEFTLRRAPPQERQRTHRP